MGNTVWITSKNFDDGGLYWRLTPISGMEKNQGREGHRPKALEQPGESINVDWVANPALSPVKRLFSKHRMEFAFKL